MAEVERQPKEDELPRKQVSAKAMGRLQQAKAAISATKSVFNFGAGNQVEAVKASRMNSAFRLGAMRNSAYFELAPEVAHLAAANPEALDAAKADLVHGGNCGEHAWIAYDYLRGHGAGDQITYAYAERDHCFVLMGDRLKEPDSEVVVADPWPTQATACLWQDHFCRTDKLDIYASMKADGKSYKNAIRAGLRLTAAGKEAAERSMTDKQTDDFVADHKKHKLWDQQDTADENKKFNYHK